MEYLDETTDSRTDRISYVLRDAFVELPIQECKCHYDTEANLLVRLHLKLPKSCGGNDGEEDICKDCESCRNIQISFSFEWRLSVSHTCVDVGKLREQVFWQASIGLDVMIP